MPVSGSLSRSALNLASNARTSLKKQVHDVMARTGLVAAIGAENMSATDREALEQLLLRLNAG